MSPSASLLTTFAVSVSFVYTVLGESVTLLTTGAVFPMVTLAVSVSVPDLPSDAVIVQTTSWPAENAALSVLEVEELLVALTVLPPTVQPKLNEVLSASASVADPAQVSVDVRVGLDGVRDAVATGARLPSVKLELPVAVPPLASVAVTAQATLAREAAVALLNESVAPEPSAVPVLLLVHA